MKNMSRMNPEVYYGVLDELDMVKRSLFPLSLYSRKIKRASDRIQEAIDIMKMHEGDLNVPIRSLKRNIKYALADLKSHLRFMDSYNTNDQRVEEITSYLSELCDMIQDQKMMMA